MISHEVIKSCALELLLLRYHQLQSDGKVAVAEAGLVRAAAARSKWLTIFVILCIFASILWGH